MREQESAMPCNGRMPEAMDNGAVAVWPSPNAF